MDQPNQHSSAHPPVATASPQDSPPSPQPGSEEKRLLNAQIDPIKAQHLQARLREAQNLSAGLFAGFGAALAGAGVWALITVLTNFQIGWMAVGVGFLVGWAVRRFGQGMDKTFGCVGALMSLFGCLVGNLLTVCIVIANREGLGVMDVISKLTPEVAFDLIATTFHPMDVLFYGLAIYWGYKYAFRRLASEELQSILA